jgi:Ca2+-binding EF-hand superfamily protein
MKFEKVFDSIDKNISGYLDYEEFKIFIIEMYKDTMEPSENAIKEAFHYIDKNKGGSISKSELKERLPMIFPGIFDE